MLRKRLFIHKWTLDRLTFKEFVRDKRRSRTSGLKMAAVV